MIKLHLAGYIEALAFAVIFMLYISGESGWILIYILLGAIALSVLTFLPSYRNAEVSGGGFAGVYSVGDKVSAEFSFAGHGFCILPYVTMSGCFMGQPFEARCSVFGRHGGKIHLTAEAQNCGLNRMFIREIVFRDFLGIIEYRMKLRPEECAAAVLPREAEYIGPEIMPILLPSSDDSEESGDTVISGGVPGYEHREYAPGDSPKRINYKLSMKRHTLMVRKDEGACAEYIDIMLMGNASSQCGEQALALAKKLVEEGGAVRVIYRNESFTVGGASALGGLREWLAFRSYSTNYESLLDAMGFFASFDQMIGDVEKSENAEPSPSASVAHTVVQINADDDGEIVIEIKQ